MTDTSPRRAEGPSISPPRRAAVLAPGRVAGTATPSAASRRVVVDHDRRVVVTTDGEITTIVTEPAEITRLVFAEYAAVRRGWWSRWPETPSHGVVGMFSGPRLVAALSVADWLPDPELVSAQEARAVSGIDALARDLDLVVESADAAEVATLRAQAQRRLVTPRPTRLGTSWGRVGATWAAMLTGLATTQAGEIEIALIWYALTTLLVGPVVILFWRERRQFVAVTSSPPPPQGRTTLRSTLPADAGGLARAELQVGSDYVVVQDRGVQLWVPGPAMGGTTHAERVPGAVALRDRRGRDVLLLDDVVWGQCDAVDEALRGAGVELSRGTLSRGLAPESRFGSQRAARMRSVTAHMAFHDHGGGSAAVGALLVVATPMYLVSGLACWYFASWAAPLVVLPLIALGLFGQGWWTLRRWDRRHLTRLSQGATA